MDRADRPQFLLAVDYAPVSLFTAVRSLRQRKQYRNLRLVVLTRDPAQPVDTQSVPAEFILCHFKTEHEISQALMPFKKDLVGVVCRRDNSIQYLRRLLPLLPKHILVASEESLAAGTNKQLMREAFQKHFPEITPQFTEVTDDSLAAIEHLESVMAYPVIVKPASLASSLLIQACTNRSQLQAALTKTFAHIHHIYDQEGRQDQPQVIVEEYLEGDFYSVDAYVMNAGQIYTCPPVGYTPAKQLGIDDFFLYKRFVPTNLSQTEADGAKEATVKALQAIGLTHSSAHVELVRTGRGWKIIEVGPRVGRFRHVMYNLAYGIDHSLNDTLIHLGEPPTIPTKLVKHCAAYSIYPGKEGILRSIANIEYLEKHPYLYSLEVFAAPGDACRFAKHGGHALAQFVIAGDNKKTFAELVGYIEAHVHAVVD